MKCYLAFAVLAGGLSSCDTMVRPLNGSGDFDPLRPPGSMGVSNTAAANVVTFSAGQFVRSIMDNTAFFKNKPAGEGDADKLLKRGTSMKVISTSGSFLKVELDSGEVGFVPTVMVEDPNAVPGVPVVNPGEYQVYPPIGEPLPQVNPGEQPPGGAIPAIIDPEAPASTAPIVPPAPLKDQFAAPEETSKPLPPNDEELKDGKKTAEPAPKIEQ